MAGDDGFREAGVQLFQQLTHRSLLSLRAGVRRTSVDVEPTLVADADRVLVVVQTVGTHHFQRTSRLDASVTANDVVVATAVLPATLAMPAVDVRSRALLARTHCRAVDDDKYEGLV